MSLTSSQVRACVIQSLREVLEEQDVKEIDDRTSPIKDLGMKSIDGIDYACILSEKLHYRIPDGLNPFVDDDRHQARTIGQIVNLMCSILEKQEAKHG